MPCAVDDWGLRVSYERYVSFNNSIVFDTNISTTEVLYTTTVNANGEGRTLTPQSDYNGWVNPEDLAPMPQCIAQQDQSTWLNAMTKCTSKRCTSHFGFFCTHQQWLTQLSCLSIGFSSDLVQGYLPYCGRSVLAKAQLYLWILNITGRTWLVYVGDANGLQDLSPASLAEGYAAVDVIYNAPTCLASSVSALSMEPFQHVIASCGFTSTTQHTGNAARPWEYSESLRSMVALDSETVGYNLARRSIEYGYYFDRECFCNTFNIDPENEPCAEQGHIDLTKERLWINATCGSTSLPENWGDTLKTTEFAYIPIENWHWPKCVVDMPRQITELTDQCATDACEIDSSGYCKVKSAVDRTCFCRNISYDSCGGSCQIFETRMDYIKWLHDLCGNLQDWQGLPDNWHQLAGLTSLDMIPWRWTIKSSNSSDPNSTETCASNEWKLGSFAIVNIATLLAAILSQRTGIDRNPPSSLWYLHPWSWVFKGTLIVALQLLASWFNILLIQKTPGYEDVADIQLLLLLCTMPRLAWLMNLPISIQPFEAMNLSMAASSLFAEMILQLLSSYYMVTTVNYGREHNFYFGALKGAGRARSAKMMYAGALMWLIVVSFVLFQLLRAICRMDRMSKSNSPNLPQWQRDMQTTSNISENLVSQLNERCTRLGQKLTYSWMDKSTVLLINSEGGEYTAYGTFSVQDKTNWVFQKAFADLYAVTVISLLLLWIAQWLFWGGFIGLSSEEYVFMHLLGPYQLLTGLRFCLPNLGFLTAVWIPFSVAGAAVGAT